MLIQWGHFKGPSGIRKTEKLCRGTYPPIFEMPPLYYLIDKPMRRFFTVRFRRLQLNMTVFSSYAFLLYLGGLPRKTEKRKTAFCFMSKLYENKWSCQQVHHTCLLRGLALALVAFVLEVGLTQVYT